MFFLSSFFILDLELKVNSLLQHTVWRVWHFFSLLKNNYLEQIIYCCSIWNPLICRIYSCDIENWHRLWNSFNHLLQLTEQQAKKTFFFYPKCTTYFFLLFIQFSRFHTRLYLKKVFFENFTTGAKRLSRVV